MNKGKAMTPRDAYTAYLSGQLTPDQAEKAVQDWYAASKPPAASPPKES